MVSENWTARSADGTVIAEGTAARLVGQDGLTLTVEPESAGAPAQG